MLSNEKKIKLEKHIFILGLWHILKIIIIKERKWEIFNSESKIFCGL